MRQVICAFLALIVLSGCQSTRPASYDYSAFRAANPSSVLVMPPINNTPEVIAPYGLLSQVVKPIAEAGYYVFPVALVNQTFIANGVTVAEDAQTISYEKLHEIFGADTGLYITIGQFCHYLYHRCLCGVGPRYCYF